MKRFLVILALALPCAVQSLAQEKPPLRLVKTIDVPGARKWDHFGVDLKGNRLFVTSEEEPAIEVVDLRTNQLLQSLVAQASACGGSFLQGRTITELKPSSRMQQMKSFFKTFKSEGIHAHLC